MARQWTVLACPTCDVLSTDPSEMEEHRLAGLKCNGLPDGERHKLVAMEEVTVVEVEA